MQYSSHRSKYNVHNTSVARSDRRSRWLRARTATGAGGQGVTHAIGTVASHETLNTQLIQSNAECPTADAKRMIFFEVHRPPSHPHGEH